MAVQRFFYRNSQQDRGDVGQSRGIADEIRYYLRRPSNVSEYLFAPVMAGHWRQHELWDGTYTLDDLADMHEIMLVQAENEQIMQDYAKSRQEVGR